MSLEIHSYILRESELFSSPVLLERVKGADGLIKWAIRCGNRCMSRNGGWAHEPIPSSRSDYFLKQNRFDSVEEAQNIWERSI